MVKSTTTAVIRHRLEESIQVTDEWRAINLIINKAKNYRAPSIYLPHTLGVYALCCICVLLKVTAYSSSGIIGDIIIGNRHYRYRANKIAATGAGSEILYRTASNVCEKK